MNNITVPQQVAHRRVGPLLVLTVGFLCLYLPTYADLVGTVWASDEQGHGPIILAVALYLLYVRRDDILLPNATGTTWHVTFFMAAGLFLYVVGRSQAILLFEVGSQILVLSAVILALGGRTALRKAWFPLFFLLFMVPLPEVLVASVTGPLKSVVSAVAANVLYFLGYPVGRAGVVLTVGQYQLLVADACAGLNSMFTLEALGLLYLNLTRSTSVVRNVALAALIIPIAFIANVVRVMILVLVTFHMGDEAGQGFVHGFAGMVLFLVGLMLMLVTDSVLRKVTFGREQST
ncbi:exosortase B [Aquincola sp. J276]|uniref:exosortase B n=1 Tax=Aquincola sp. J276 TaxID=2898432 RepID=UPI0021513009|nr:exosortase B [Aquincola sp. J276]MCR5866785.1 exosortase B [Aquincola sp. J276]